jgi:putative ABC transport system permease protein
VLLIFTLRHLLRHWRMNLAVLAGMTLCAALLAGLPMYVAVIAGQSLEQSLEHARSSVRNLEVHGRHLSQGDADEIAAELGELVQERVEIREAVVDVERAVYQADGERRMIDEVLFLRLWSFPLENKTVVLDGRLPKRLVVSEAEDVPVLEVAVGTRAAGTMDLALGDGFVLEHLSYRVRIVGVVEPADPTSDLWWSDQTLQPFSVERVGMTDVDNLYLSLLLPAEMMVDHVPDHAMYWRVLLHWDRISGSNALRLRDTLVGLAAQLSARGARTETGLVDLLARYRSQLALGRTSLFLLTAQSLLAVLYTLGSLSAFLVDRSHIELASMVERGFGHWQITGVFAFQGLLLALTALPLGPLVARACFDVWSRLSGESAVVGILREAWALSCVAAASGWLALVISVHLAARHNLLDWQRQRARPPRRLTWQRLAIDVFLLALGGLIYWQLRDTGSFVREAGDADLVLLLGPSLLLLAISLAFQRVFPVFLQVLAWLSSAARSLVLPLGTTRLARDPSTPNRVILLISLTAGLVFFANVFGHSISQRQRDIAHYMAGADVRVALSQDAAKAADDSASIASMPGVVAASQVYRGEARWSAFKTVGVNYRPADVLAVDPARFAQIARYPSGIGDRSMQDVMLLLQTGSSGSLPALLSPDAPPGSFEVGDRIQYRIADQVCEFEVRGIIDEFPTLSTPFLVTDLVKLEQQADLSDALVSTGRWRELWLDVDPVLHTTLVETLKSQPVPIEDAAFFEMGRIAADSEAQLRAFRSDLIAQITTAAFGLNAVVLVVLSSASFLLVQVFSAHRRVIQFGVLRAIGLSSRQLLGLLILEGCVMVALGLLTGTGVGYGLAYAMRPFLSLTLSSSLGGKAIDRVVMDWSAIAQSYGVLIGFHVLSLFVLLVVLIRSNIHRTLRMGDE